MSTTNHRLPCVAGSVCGEPAHCPPVDRPTADHGSAGFCTDHAQPAQPAPDERMETVARVLFTWNTGKTPYFVITSEFGREVPIDDPYRPIAAAVVAALDDETARLRAEVEQVIRAGQAVARGATTRIEILTSDIAAARAALDRVRALATDSRDRGGFGGMRLVAHVRIADLLAALDPAEGTDAHVPASERRLVLPQPPAEWLRDMSEEPNV